MPSKKPRIVVLLDDDVKAAFQADARRHLRTDSAHVVWLMRRYLAGLAAREQAQKAHHTAQPAAQPATPAAPPQPVAPAVATAPTQAPSPAPETAQ